MSKASFVDINYSHAHHWGYLKQDGVAFQSAGGCGPGGGSDGIVRHHIWVNNAFKPAVRWDGSEEIGGLDHHVVGVNTPGLTLTKGDEHRLFHNTGVLGFDNNNAMMKLRLSLIRLVVA